MNVTKDEEIIYIVGEPSDHRGGPILKTANGQPQTEIHGPTVERFDMRTGTLKREKREPDDVGAFAGVGGWVFPVKRGVVQDTRVGHVLTKAEAWRLGRRVVARIMPPETKAELAEIDRQLVALRAKHQEILDAAVARAERVHVEMPEPPKAVVAKAPTSEAERQVQPRASDSGDIPF